MMSAALIATLSLAQPQESPKRCVMWCHRRRTLTRHGVNAQEGSSCRDAAFPESGGKPLAIWYFISNLDEIKGFVRQIVLSTDNCRKYTMQKFTSSQTPSHVWEKERWTKQNSSSPQDGVIFSRNTRNRQEELMVKRFSSYSTYFLAQRREKTKGKKKTGP